MIENFMRVQRILWLAMLMSLVAMGVVAFVLPAQTQPAPHFFLGIFIVVAVSLLVLVQVLRGRLMPAETGPTALDDKPKSEGTPEESAALAKLAQAHVISWALCESVATLGLACRVLLGPPVYYVGFAAVSAVFLVLYRPDPEDAAGAIRAVQKR
jgi:hypothetical protein